MRNDTGKTIGTLYGLGIGPGDPGLITVKGMETIRKTAEEGGTIFAPAGKLAEGSLVKSILKRSGTDTSSWQELEFPMSGDPTVLKNKWRTSAEHIAPVLYDGFDAVFLTLGDPSVYSTWIYLRREMAVYRPAIACVTIPGIQTANAAAAACGIPLVEGKERMALLPAPDNPDELLPILELFPTVVLYKVGHRFPALRAFLEKQSLTKHSYYAEKLGLPEEIISNGIDTLPDSASGYLSTVIIKTETPKGGSAA